MLSNIKDEENILRSDTITSNHHNSSSKVARTLTEATATATPPLLVTARNSYTRATTIRDGQNSIFSVDSDSLYLAAVYVKDALHYWDSEHYRDSDHLHKYLWYRSTIYRKTLLVCILGNLLLAYWENSLDSTSINKSTVFILASIEILCLMAIFIDGLLKKYWECAQAWSSPVVVCQIIFTVLLLCDLVQFLLVRFVVFNHTNLRYLRALRVFFLINYNLNTRLQAQQVLKTMYSMLIPYMVLILVVFWESLLAMLLFYQPATLHPEAAQSVAFQPNSPYSPAFDSFDNLFFSMFFLGTTENFPDVALPSIQTYGFWAAFFYVSCVICGVYIGLNLIVAYVYNIYRAEAVNGAKTKFNLRQQSLMRAFELLDVNMQGYLTMIQWRLLATELFRLKVLSLPKNFSLDMKDEFHRDRQLEMVADLYFQFIDNDDSRKLDMREFYSLCDYLALKFEYTGGHSNEKLNHKVTPKELLTKRSSMYVRKQTRAYDPSVDLTNNNNSIKRYDGWLHGYIENPHWQYVRAILMIISAILQIEPFLSCNDNIQAISCLYDPLALFVIDCLFLAFVGVELILLWCRHRSKQKRKQQKYLISGTESSSSISFLSASNQHSFETVIFILSLASKLIFEVGLRQSNLSYDWLRLVLLFRLLKFMRIFSIVKELRIAIQSILRLMYSLSSSFVCLLMIYYVYAMIGMQCFAGLLNGNSTVLANTAFVQSNYFIAVNFDSFAAALFTLFHLQLLNNWHLTCSALVISSGTRWTYVFVGSYYYVVCLTLVNLLIAFVIEAVQHSVRTHEQQEQTLRRIEKRQRREAYWDHFHIIRGLHDTTFKDAHLELFKQELEEV